MYRLEDMLVPTDGSRAYPKVPNVRLWSSNRNELTSPGSTYPAWIAFGSGNRRVNLNVLGARGRGIDVRVVKY